MASIDFYALKDDICALVTFIFEEIDLRIFESYSEYDKELREFRSLEELSAAFSLGSDAHLRGNAALLQLWSPAVMEKFEIERIDLKVKGHSFRHRISGVGLIQLNLGGEHQGIISSSRYGHWSEAGARQRADRNVEAVDWTALSRLSHRVQRQIRKTAIAKVEGCLILPAAFAALQRSFRLRFGPADLGADTPEIQLLK